MLQKLLGGLLIVAVLLPIPFAVVGISGARELFGQVNDVVSGELEPIRQDFSSVRTQLGPVWQDLKQIPADVQSAVDGLAADFDKSLNGFSTGLPAFSIPISIPTVSSQTSCDGTALVSIPYPSKVDLTKTKQIDATGNTDFSNLLQGALGVKVTVTVPDFTNAVTTKCIVIQAGTPTVIPINPGQLPNIPGLDQANDLFTNTRTFLLGSTVSKVQNGISQLITRLAAVENPLEAIDKWLNDIETFRGKLEAIQQSWEGRIGTYLTLGGLCIVLLYGIVALLAIAQGIRMMVGAKPTKS